MTQNAADCDALFRADVRLVATWARKNSINHLVKESSERLLTDRHAGERIDRRAAEYARCAHCDRLFGRPVGSVPNRCRHGLLCGPCKWDLDEVSGFHLPEVDSSGAT